MARVYPDLRFERYADDALVHCGSEAEARSVLEAIRGRLAECGLELHPTKTRIVYCKDDDRPGKYEHDAFDFLGYTFQPRRAKEGACVRSHIDRISAGSFDERTPQSGRCFGSATAPRPRSSPRAGITTTSA